MKIFDNIDKTWLRFQFFAKITNIEFLAKITISDKN